MHIASTKLDVDVVLMDVDGTMTNEKRDNVFSASPLEHLINLIMEKYGVSTQDAYKMVYQVGNPETVCLFDFLEILDISRQLYWSCLADDLRKSIEIPEDVGIFMKFLKAHEIKLYSATTNSKMMTLLKISLGELASMDGSQYFSGFFGGDTFGDPRGKFSEDFFPSIMKTGNFDPERTMMIGDSEEWDMVPALRCGIKNVVIINRMQNEPIIYKSGAFFVSSLFPIMEIL